MKITRSIEVVLCDRCSKEEHSFTISIIENPTGRIGKWLSARLEIGDFPLWSLKPSKQKSQLELCESCYRRYDKEKVKNFGEDY